MQQQHLDLVIDALEDLYPGKFTEMSTAELALWKKEVGDTSLETALAAVRRWYMNHLRQYIPTLISLVMLMDEIEQEERKELARHRAATTGTGLPGVLEQASAAYIANARDDNTALYGRLMGALAQRSLSQKMTKPELAAQCQAWTDEYPQLLAPLTRASAYFLSGWDNGTVPMLYSATQAQGEGSHASAPSMAAQ